MTILEYYKTQQNNPLWYNKFQSTSNKQSGKTFSYINTNYRYMLSFLKQFDEFKKDLKIERHEWKDKLPCGQDMNKHRIVNLTKAGFVIQEDDYFSPTPKGITILDLIEENLDKNESWLLLYLLLLDFKSDLHDFDIIFTVKDLIKKIDISSENLKEQIKYCLKMTSRSELFFSDLFWLISFANDENFIKAYENSTDMEKNELKEYVVKCSETANSKDLIAKKFKSSGVYSVATFIDDLKVIYFSLIVLESYSMDFSNYIDNIINEYKNIYSTTNEKAIYDFINGHKSNYIKVKQLLLGGIHDAKC